MLSIPFFNVTVLESQVRHAPLNFNRTFPSINPRNSMSPPSSWMDGRILVSRSSLIKLTTSLSLSLYASVSCDDLSWLVSGYRSSMVFTIGSPEVTASVMRLNTSGFTYAQFASGTFVTVMKSGP